MGAMPGILQGLTNIKKHVGRVNDFMILEDLDRDYIKRAKGKDFAIHLENGNFYWTEEGP